MMTLNGVIAVILHYFTELGATYVKAVEVSSTLSATKCSTGYLDCRNIWFMAIRWEVT